MREMLFGVLRVVGAGILASFLFVGHDLQRLGPVEPEEFEVIAVLLRRLALVGGACGIVWAVLWLVVPLLRKLGHRLGKRPDLLPAIAITVLLIPYQYYLTKSILSGAGIGRLVGIEILRIAAPVAVFLGVLFCSYLVLRVAALIAKRKLSVRLLFGLCLIVLALCIELLDESYYPGLYLFMHDFAFFVALSLATLGAVLLLPQNRMAQFVCTMLILFAGLAALGDRVEVPTIHQRSILFRRTLQGRRILAFWRLMGRDEIGFFDRLGIDADFQAERKQIRMQFDDARVELEARLGRQPVKNVIWLTIDTLRADHLSAYGYDRPTSPSMERLAARATKFDRHYAQFPITSFSFQSMFFSRYPSATPLFRRAKDLPDDPKGNISLAQHLTDRGITTVSFPAIPPVSLSHPSYEALALGFQEVNPSVPPKSPLSAESQMKWATKRLEGMGADRFFMWIHLMDPHAPYIHHDDYNFGDRAIDAYDSEIAYVDRQIGKLLVKLETLGLADSTAIVINSDHGEAFGEHNSQFHGTTLYDEQLHVPCILYVPGLQPQVVKSLTNNIDLMPTILDLMAVKVRSPIQGQTLIGYLMDGDLSPVRPVSFAYAEIPSAIPEMDPANTNKQMIVSGRFKLLANQRDEFAELFDLTTDPKEEKNISDRESELVAQLSSIIKSLQEEGRNLNLPEGARSDQETFDSLRDALKGGTVPARCALLMANLPRKHPQLEKIALERLNDPKEHELVKMTILENGADLLGEKLMPYMRSVLSLPPFLGSAALVLDLWLERGLPLNSRDRTLVSLNMRFHPQVGWRAARLLAAFDDPRASLQLAPALALGDRNTAFASAAGLGQIENGDGLERLRRDFVFYSLDPDRCTAAIKALATLEDRKSLPQITQLVQNRYLHYRIKFAALEYFMKFEQEDAIPGLLYLCSGWDPNVDKEVFQRMVKAFGKERAEVIRKNGRFVSEVDDLVQQKRIPAALKVALSIIKEVGGARQAAPLAIVAGHLGYRLGRTDQVDVVLRELEDSRAPQIYRDVARAMRKPQGDKTYRLEVLDLRPVNPTPIAAGLERRFHVRIRNVGDRTIPGGNDPSGLSVKMAFAGDHPPGDLFLPPSKLPAWGLPPGGEAELNLLAGIPSPGQFYSLGVEITRLDFGPMEVVDKRESKEVICVADPLKGGLTVESMRFDSEQIRQNWEPTRSFYPAVINPDKSVAFLAFRIDPGLRSPLFKAGSKPLKLSVDFDTEKHAGINTEVFEVYYRYEGEPHFVFHQRIAIPYNIDNVRRKMKFELPLKNGKSPVQVRLDPFSAPHLFLIHSITIKEM
ncbi:MAG: arylsulfatase A-like enzyme [Planctomycetota bacterium]|jgi:arylsulfatase A-like enzyme